MPEILTPPGQVPTYFDPRSVVVITQSLTMAREFLTLYTNGFLLLLPVIAGAAATARQTPQQHFSDTSPSSSPTIPLPTFDGAVASDFKTPREIENVKIIKRSEGRLL